MNDIELEDRIKELYFGRGIRLPDGSTFRVHAIYEEGENVWVQFTKEKHHTILAKYCQPL